MKPTRQNLTEIMKLMKDKKILTYLISALVLLVITTLCTLVFPSLSAKIIDEFFSTGIINKHLFIILIVIGLVSAILSYFNEFIIYRFSERFSFLARNWLYEKIISQPERYFITHDKSKLLTVIMSDVNFVKEILSQFVTLSVTSVLMILGSAILMFSLNYRLALVIIIFVPVIMITLFLIMRNIRKLFMKIQLERDNFNRTIDENVKASMLIRVFSSEKEEAGKFEVTNKKTFDLQRKIIGKFSIMIPGVNFVNFISALIIIFIGGTYTINGTMTLGQISAFSTYVTMFIMPMMMISMISNMIGQAFASLERINDVLASENDFVDGKEKDKTIESIKTEKLCFDIDKKQILKDIDFEARKGEKIGIIGLTGSGKSMLMQLMLRLVEPVSGRILVNGADIKKFQIETVRAKTGIVFQDNFLMDDTINSNIDFKRGLPEKDIEFARKVADVDEFYTNNPQDYMIGELGRKLSGGQKQRIRIARAIAAKPDLLILDDCTSNLDVKTEKKIISNIRGSLKDITIIIISQKIASLSDCDRIYVMDNGKITEKGTHKELLETSLLYKEIELTQKNRNS
jgi:ATP-binding cassette, subfamily B, bacterial